MERIELCEIDKFYNKFKSNVITFTNKTTKRIGLIQKDVKVNIGIFKFNGAVISSSMENITIIARLDGYLKEMVVSKKHMATVELKFLDNLYKKTSVFKLYGKVHDIDPYSTYKNVYTIDINITRKIPEELILKYCEYFTLLTSKDDSEIVEGMFFVNGTRKKCIASNLTKENLFIEVNSDTPERYIDQKAIVVIKNHSSGDVYEIIGRTDTKFIRSNHKFRVKLNYSNIQQGPRFNLSYDSLITILNRDSLTSSIV